MLNDYQFRSIWIPKDWDEVRDLVYYTKIQGGSAENPHEHILNNVERCTDELGGVLNNAIPYLRRRLKCPRLVPLMAMPLAEKIRFLADIVETIPMKRDIRNRIVGGLVYCLWVEGQREKLLGMVNCTRVGVLAETVHRIGGLSLHGRDALGGNDGVRTQGLCEKITPVSPRYCRACQCFKRSPRLTKYPIGVEPITF